MNRYLSLTGLILALLASAACATAPPALAPTVSPPPAATLPPTSTPIPSPTPSPSPQPTPTPSPRPSFTPTLPPVPPAATAFGLWIATWSPNGHWLAYRTATQEDADQNPYEGTSILPYGTFHFLDVRIGAGCEYAKDNRFGIQLNLWHGWLPDGRLMTLDTAGQAVVLGEPCAGESAAPLVGEARPLCLVTNPDSGQSCSPDGRRLGQTGQTQSHRTTTITDTITGQTEAVITWSSSDYGIGPVAGPYWLDNDRFLIVASDDGPLLVTLGAEVQVQYIAPDLFGLPGSTGQIAMGTLIPGTSDYHLLLHSHNLTSGINSILLYHSESGLVETLLAAYAYLAPNGLWLELRGDDSNPAWFRPLDPPHSEPRQYLTSEDDNYSGWSDDWTRVAVPRQSRLNGQSVLRAYGMPAGTLLKEWGMGQYSLGVPIWSPDNHYLAAAGYSASSQVYALFVIEVPN